MKKAHLALALIFACNSAFSSGISEQTEAAIASSHEAARKLASSFLVEDLGLLIQRIASAESGVNQKGQNSLAQQILTLNEMLMKELDRVDTIQDIDPQVFRDLENAYRLLVRERLRVSFEAQEVEMQKLLMIRSLQSAFESFEGLCKVGRSGPGAVPAPGFIPNIPKTEYEFKMIYGTNEAGGNAAPSSFIFHSIGPSSESQNRNTINGILGTSAGLSWSIAASGAAGASVAVAMAVAPWLAGAFALYSAFNYVASNQEEIDRQNEMARARSNLFLKSANDRDIANYYQESCTKTSAKLKPLADLIYSYTESHSKREQIVRQISASKLEREGYKNAVAEIEKYRKLLSLASAKHKGICDEAQEVKPCKKEGDTYVLTSDTAVVLSQDEDKDKPILEEAQRKMAQFNEQFSQEKVVELIAFDILDLIHNRWNAISAEVASWSFQQTDRALNVLSNKLKFFAAELHKAKNSRWAEGHQLVGVNEVLQAEFFALRAEYFELLNIAVKAFFNKHDIHSAKARFKSFSARFKAFSDKTMISRDVQSMSLSVSRLEKFYEEL